MKILRYDKGEIRRAIFTPEGFLKVDAICTRTGVFRYANPDGSLRRELRHPDDVLKQDSLRTLEMIPITLLHPAEKIVDSSNSVTLSKGMTGESVQVDGKFIKNRLLIMHQDAINAVVNGVQELSLGYAVNLVEEAGEYDGERYDFRQTEIEYNHLAIVPSARAGSDARIILDGTDAAQDIEVNNVRMDDLKLPTARKIDSQSPIIKRRKRMDKIKLDGIEYDSAPEVINALNKSTVKIDGLEKQVEALTQEKSTMQANFDSMKEKLDALEKVDNAAEIQKGVEARTALLAEVTPHLDEETAKKAANMSDSELKQAVIMAKFPAAKLDGKDATYIQARYDAALEVKVDKPDDAMAEQRKQVNGDNAGSGTKLDADTAKRAFTQNLQNAWKPESK